MENTNIETTTVETSLEQEGATQPEGKTYTEQEVLALIQKEGDRRVSQALKTAESKFEKKFTEAEKLRNMDEQQRLQYQNEQLKNQIAEMEKQAALAENTKQATAILSERKLPVQFVEYVLAADADTMMANIDTFDRMYKAAVADEVARRIGTSGAPSGRTGKQTGLTSLKGMSLAERQQLKDTNPTLYNSLIGGY